MRKTIFLLLLLLSLANAFTISEFDYDVDQSKQFQSFCVITHCNWELLMNWNCKLCPKITKLQNISYIENNLTNAVALVGYHPKINAILMVFRGTEDVKNWLEDFSYYQVLYPRCKNCKIHSGFYAAYLSLSVHLSLTIEKLRQTYPSSRIISLGSSLGASIATIAALQMQISHGNADELHTFGCPRIGDQNFVQFLSQKLNKIRRVVHNRDIVPHVPLISQNFMHPSYEIWFDGNMEQYQVCNQSGQDPKCSDSLYPNYSIEDHIGYWQKPIPSQICQ